MNLAKQIINGNRTALAQGITLLESALPENEKKSQDIILACQPYSGGSIRIGVTGVPGVGKSTFIESFGKLLTSKGKKVAVLAIDPTSEKTKGSILGDKSRMQKLAADNNAFIRPSPSNGSLGGVGNKTRESIILCEAAGFEIILVETVGVGQSETTVNNLVDFFLLLILSGAGDYLQAIKRGIMEFADALVVTKADGANITNSMNAALDYKTALHHFPKNENGWIPQVITCSTLENIGIMEIFETVNKFDKKMIKSGWKAKNRKNQKKYWLHHKVKEELGNKKYKILLEKGKLKTIEKELNQGKSISQLLINL